MDGFVENSTTGETQDNEHTLGGSLYVVARPNDSFTIELNYFGQDRDDGLAQFPQATDLFSISNDAPTEEETQSHIVGLS